MNLVRYKFNCKIIKLFRLGNRQLEIIFCPARSTVPIHYHSSVDSLIIHIYGSGLMNRNDNKRLIDKFTWFNCFFIPHGVLHGIEIFNNWFIFLNWERWYPAIKPTTIADDIAYER